MAEEIHEGGRLKRLSFTAGELGRASVGYPRGRRQPDRSDAVARVVLDRGVVVESAIIEPVARRAERAWMDRSALLQVLSCGSLPPNPGDREDSHFDLSTLGSGCCVR